MNDQKPLLTWKTEYSVGVELIDFQHRQMFDIINELVGIINAVPTQEAVTELIEKIVSYKKVHYASEEDYFREFHYEGAEEHIAEHARFNESLLQLKDKYPGDPISFCFELVDFLENWLVTHIMDSDQKYVACFHAHGLK